jgi:ankyrin repeat protein
VLLMLGQAFNMWPCVVQHIVEYLLSIGASVNIRDSCVLLNTPLHYASRAGHEETVRSFCCWCVLR